jgi:hypothetical protein
MIGATSMEKRSGTTMVILLKVVLNSRMYKQQLYSRPRMHILIVESTERNSAATAAGNRQYDYDKMLK